MIPELSHVADPAYLAGLAQVPTDRIREMRVECSDLENSLSYVRRLAQGRLDLLLAETQRRGSGRGGDLADIVDSLPDVLSEGVRGPGSGRVSQELDPPDHLVEPLVADLDSAVGPSVMAALVELGNDELSAAVIALRRFEDRLSSARHSLHDTIDALNTDLARRIAGGDESITTS